MGKQQDIPEVINGSGFPFQIAVTDFVKRGKQDSDCRVLFTEHSWRDSAGEYSGFIDLVVASDIFPYIFVIECKRHLDGVWVFLQAAGTVGGRRHAKLFVNVVDRQKSPLHRKRHPLVPDWVSYPQADALGLHQTTCCRSRATLRNHDLMRMGPARRVQQDPNHRWQCHE